MDVYLVIYHYYRHAGRHTMQAEDSNEKEANNRIIFGRGHRRRLTLITQICTYCTLGHYREGDEFYC